MKNYGKIHIKGKCATGCLTEGLKVTHISSMKNITKRLLCVLLSASTLFFFSHTALAGKEEMPGDADSDEKISAADARLVLRFSVNLDVFSKADLKVCDINSDGLLTSADARSILRSSVGLESIPDKIIYVSESEHKNLINGEPENPMYKWEVPPYPAPQSPSGTFTFTVYGYGHGVGLSQCGAVEMAKYGCGWEDILTHYYTGTEIKDYGKYPEKTVYPTIGEIDTEQLVAKIAYTEIYGLTDEIFYEEAVKAQSAAIFTLLAYFNFDISNRWDVGIASNREYDELPEQLRRAVHEVMGKYITQRDKKEPVQAVYSCLATGYTASAKDIWQADYPYLQAVESPWDMRVSSFISEKVYTADEMKRLITQYSDEIVLSENPAQWLEIIRHTESIDSERGYVVEIRVGDKTLDGYNQFCMELMENKLRSACFVITYTP